MAKKIMVKCKYCGLQFDRNNEPCVLVSPRRYAHKACAEKYQNELPKEERDYQALEKYIKELFNTNVLNAKTKKQIKDYKQQYNYTYSGMLKTLKWWYEIKGNSIEMAQGGIGIIPYIYQEALKYYYGLFLAQSANQEVNDFKPKVKEIEIGSPRVAVNPIKLFKIDDEEDRRN